MENKDLLAVLEKRFHQHMHRHPKIKWADVLIKLDIQPEKLSSLGRMEDTGGEPDVIFLESDGAYVFADCSAESPTGRRSLCYDRAAWEVRKKFKPENNAVDVANEMGIQLLTENDYLALQALEAVDSKTSSWIHTPDSVRSLGGALFGDFRFGRVFFYHNGAESYYAARGFRGKLII